VQIMVFRLLIEIDLVVFTQQVSASMQSTPAHHFIEKLYCEICKYLNIP